MRKGFSLYRPKVMVLVRQMPGGALTDTHRQVVDNRHRSVLEPSTAEGGVTAGRSLEEC